MIIECGVGTKKYSRFLCYTRSRR